MNKLYYGDNLEIMRSKIKNETVDLCYIDPPFNSNRNYFQIYDKPDGKKDKAQEQAFTDTWTWDKSAIDGYKEIITNKDNRFTDNLIRLMKGLNIAIGNCDLMAYLVSMSLRVTEIHRALKSTGSFYLHCDQTASHYLKLVLDAIFGPSNFRNEIAWHYGLGASRNKDCFLKKHDDILFYTKSDKAVLNILRGEVTDAMDSKYCHSDELGRYMMSYGKKYYLKGGKQMDDVWDIPTLSPTDSERLGYPTQKPEALLKRIILASSNEGDVVLDAFCGSGTTLCMAKKLNRNYIGIDKSHAAIDVSKKRLESPV